MRTLAHAANVHFFHRRPQEVLEKGLRAIELARHADDPHTEVLVRSHTLRTLELLGDRERAEQHAGAMLAVAERLRDRSLLAQALWLNGSLAHHGGDWQATRAFLDRGLTLTPLDPRLSCTRSVLEYEVGDFGQGEAYRERLLDATRRSSMGVGLS